MGLRFILALLVMGGLSWMIAHRLVGPSAIEIRDLDEEAEAYVLKAVPAVVEHWDAREWQRRAAIELREAIPLHEMKQAFAEYRSALGPFRELGKVSGSAFVDEVRGVKYPTGTYVTTVRFRYGTATISSKVVKKGGGWKFQKFSVRTSRVSEDVL